MFEKIDPHRFLDIYNYFEGMREGCQRRKLGEEHQELIEELVKFDKGIGDVRNIIDELADNIFILFQIMYAYEIEPQEVYDQLLYKMDRTEKRKIEKYYEK